MSETWVEVDRRVGEWLALEDEVLAHALAASEAAGLPAISVSAPQGKLLNLPARQCGAPFDFTFIDADKASTPEYIDWSIRLSRPGAFIVVDNVVRNGAVLLGSSTDASVQGARRALAMLGHDPRVEATAIQTVGSKGYDGFALALVKAR